MFNTLFYVALQERQFVAETEQVKHSILQATQTIDPLTRVSKNPEAHTHLFKVEFNILFKFTKSHEVQNV